MNKKLLFTLSLAISSFYGFAQEFSFKMYFEDAAGNRDSILLGYDVNGTNAVDPSFGENNIMNTPFKAGLDVRAGNIWWKKEAAAISYLKDDPIVKNFLNQTPFQSRTQIVRNMKTCIPGSVWKGDYFKVLPIIELNIATAHWPVRAYWDKEVFNNDCVRGSVFTNTHPGAWWDGGQYHFRSDMSVKNEEVFNLWDQSYWIDHNNIKVPVYWVAFADSSLIMNELQLEKLLSVSSTGAIKGSFKTYPNPTTGQLQFDVPARFGKIESIEVYSIVGQKLLSLPSTSNSDISTLSSGTYFIVIRNNEGQQLSSTVTKQ
jgi:hypothetical protein